MINKKNILGISFSVLSLGLIFSMSIINGKGYEETTASAYSASSLPTTIDLNDTSASNVRSYYSGLNSLSTSERRGTNLLKNLKPILKNGQKYYSYENGTSIWQMYEITDRDWDKSPASSTEYGTYNSSTNKITNYTYGTSSSSSKNNPYIHALYINRDVNNQTTAWDDHSQDEWGINREHVWPKAEGFDSSGAGGARGDPMHLMAGNGYANNIHSNYYYGYVDTDKSYTDCGSKYSNQSGNLRGSSKTFKSASGTVFEPQDCDKGDIARAIFYMVARYNYYSGSDSDGIDTNNPNLVLTNNLSDWSSSGYTSSTSTTGKLGLLQDLLEWNRLDPPDAYEIHRNNLLYTNFTNNRNPFIDFPEWAEYIWGKSTNGSYDSTSTGHATPSTDTLNDFSSGGQQETVSVTGVTLNKNSTSIEAGSTETLVATVSPNNATDQSITWSSNDESVATVSDGTVTGVAEGSATITATTNDGGYTATCAVTVTASSGGGQDSDSVDAPYTLDTTTGNVTIATNNSYASYAETDTGHKWTVTLGSKQTNSPAGLWVGSNSTQSAKMVLSNGGYSEASAIASAIGVTASSTYYSAVFQQAGGHKINNVGSATLTYGGTSGTAPSEAWVVYSTDDGETWNVMQKKTSLSQSGTTFTASSTIDSALYGLVIHCTGYGTMKAPVLTLNAAQKSLSSISLNTTNVTKTFTVGDSFSYSGLAVTAHYSDDSSKTVTPTSVSTPDMSTTGQKTVTVSYTEGGVTKTAEYTISVNAAPASSITATPKKTFYVGDEITKADITVVDNNENEITDYTFNQNGYQFGYEDTASGGALTNKQFDISYGNLNTTLTVQVQRKAHVVPSQTTDTLNQTWSGITGTSYVSWTDKAAPTSDAVHAGNCAGSNSSIQLRSGTSKNSNVHSGIVSTTSGGTLNSVTVVWQGSTPDGRTLNVYGKNTAYTDQEDLYSNNADTQGTLLGTIVKGTSTSLTITGSYTYIGLRSADGAMYLTSISITYGASDSAKNLANYIMYTDTTGQCNTKYPIAVGYFEELTSGERSTFMTSTDYVIETARERLEAWATAKGQTISYSNNDYVVKSGNFSNPISGIFDNEKAFSPYNVVLLIAILGFIASCGCFYSSRKKEY